MLSPIEKTQKIEQFQDKWINHILNIGLLHRKNEDVRSAAQEFVSACYGYDLNQGTVLFKPTLASEQPFRPTKQGAISYFIGGNTAFPEDDGFALQPWRDITCTNFHAQHYQDHSIVMGQMKLTTQSGQSVVANYTMSFVWQAHQCVLMVHHSSLQPGN